MPNSEVSRSEFDCLENDVSSMKYSLDKANKDIEEMKSQIRQLMAAVNTIREGGTYDE